MVRALFAAVFFAAQVALIATAGSRSQHAFGFRMFADFATMRVRLVRRLASGQLVPVEGQAWFARGPDGRVHRISWADLVEPRGPMVLDYTVRAPYGAATQLAVLDRALGWALDHLSDDVETVALIATVTMQTNGAPPLERTLMRSRSLPGSGSTPP